MKELIKKILIIGKFLDFVSATRYFNKKYFQILKWTFSSREDTNFTYDVTDKNNLELLKIIESCVEVLYEKLQKYLNEILNDDHLKIYLKKKTEESEFKSFADRNISFRVG